MKKDGCTKLLPPELFEATDKLIIQEADVLADFVIGEAKSSEDDVQKASLANFRRP